ncbi:MAG: histidine kinase [Cytophagales bacterium]|nr:histidine kinase [Cytophagales bacterium]
MSLIQFLCFNVNINKKSLISTENHIASETRFHQKLSAKEPELNMLKSQVNPHFLFNAPNTLYATALNENATTTSASIAKPANLIGFKNLKLNLPGPMQKIQAAFES